MTGTSAMLLNGCLVFLLGAQIVSGQAVPSAASPEQQQIITDSLSPASAALRMTTGEEMKLNGDQEPDSVSGVQDIETVPSRKNMLLNLIYKDSTRYYTDEKISAMQADLVRFDGKVIRDIIIRRVDMFAPSVMDTGYVAATRLQRTGNKLHTDTRDKIIRRNILIGPGEKIDALLLMENERIIRSLPYIMDARFIVRTRLDDSTAADVELLVKDLWPVGLGLEISDLNAGNAGLWNANILGLGHQFGSQAYWNGNHEPLFGYDVFYGISNMGGSFFTTQMEYRHRWNEKSFRANLTRDFKTSELKFAGAARLEIVNLQRDIPMLDTTLSQVSTEYTMGEIWTGRLFSLTESKDIAMRSNLFFSGGVKRILYQKAPETSINYLYDYQDRTQLMFSLGYSRQGFQKDNHIYTFERTEDVPFGYLIEVVSGMEWGQYKNRPYIAGSLSAGNYLDGLGYLYGIFQYGTFIYRGATEQGLIHLRLRYFTDLHHGNRFDFRGFATLTYQHIIHPYTGEYITLENGNGIKGLSSPIMRGDEKVILSLESVIFSPLQLLGFRFVFFASVDMGLIRNNGTTNSGNNYYSGLGLGVRIRNDKLVFDTFELKFSFYPGQPQDARTRQWYAGSVPGLMLADFYPGRPAPLDYLP